MLKIFDHSILLYFIESSPLARGAYHRAVGARASGRSTIFHRHFHPCAWWEYILHQLPGGYGMSLVTQCAAHLVQPGTYWLQFNTEQLPGPT